jgi:16S rRNA processing protein RimM
MSDERDAVFLGSFVKAHGIRGELKLLTSEDFWPDVLESQELWVEHARDDDVERRPVQIERVRPHQGQYIIKLEGIDDRSDAEAEVGGRLFIPLDRLDVELPDHDLPFQVIGTLVRTEDGRVLGRVSGVLASAAQEVYEVTGEDGSVLIPAVPAFIVAHDRERGEITIRTIPGLIDG